MSVQQWIAVTAPGALALAVAAARPPVPADDAVRRSVGNWVANDQTVARLAAPRAEPYLHHYLDEAERIGARHGRAAAVVVCLPITVLVTVAWIFLLTLS